MKLTSASKDELLEWAAACLNERAEALQGEVDGGCYRKEYLPVVRGEIRQLRAWVRRARKFTGDTK